MRPVLRVVGILVLIFLLPACASRQTVAPFPLNTSRLVVLNLPDSVRTASLHRVMHPDDEKTGSAEANQHDRQVVATKTAAVLQQQLLAHGFTANTVVPAEGEMGKPFDTAVLAALQQAHPADYYLRVAVTDYGETPESWKGSYVTFEVVSTLGIAGALYIRPVTRPLAGAYLLEEGIEEYSEGYAGFWVLNRLSRPVRVAADMVDARTGLVVWHTSATGLARWRWGHLWKMTDDTRDSLLDTSLEKALASVLDDFQRLPGASSTGHQQ